MKIIVLVIYAKIGVDLFEESKSIFYFNIFVKKTKMPKPKTRTYKAWGGLELHEGLSCNLCDYVGREKAMRLHVKMKHPSVKYSSENQYKFCSFHCKTRKEYKDHLKEIHPNK